MPVVLSKAFLASVRLCSLADAGRGTSRDFFCVCKMASADAAPLSAIAAATTSVGAHHRGRRAEAAPFVQTRPPASPSRRTRSSPVGGIRKAAARLKSRSSAACVGSSDGPSAREHGGVERARPGHMVRRERLRLPTAFPAGLGRCTVDRCEWRCCSSNAMVSGDPGGGRAATMRYAHRHAHRALCLPAGPPRAVRHPRVSRVTCD